MLPPSGPFDSTQATVSSRIDNGRVLRQEIPLNSDRQLRKTIDDLRRLERKCFAARSRFAFYDYLAAVFELYVRLRRTKSSKTCGPAHCQPVRSSQAKPHPPHQDHHRRDLDGTYQDPKPMEPGLAVRLARTQNLERPWVVLAGKRRACWVR